MAATNSDLFLLMFNLSLINDMAQIKRIYVESMNYTYKQLQFSINSPVNEIDENERIPIVNGESDFGTLLIKGDLNLIDSVELSYIRNSVGLLAVILQNRTFAQTLTREKISLEERAKDREFQIRLSLEEIRRLKNTLSNVIDSMPSILIGVDENNEVTHWNSQAENFYKIKTHDALGRQLLKVVPFLEKQIEDIYEVINNKKIKKHDEIFKNPEGEIHNMETTIYPLLDTEHGGAVIRIDDITEKIRMEEMMVQSEKMMSVGGLSAGMAHEINNPLAGIIQTANVMNSRLSKNMDIPPSKKAAEEAGTTIEAIKQFMENRDIPRMLSTITDSGKRISEIIDNMLSFSRSDNSKTSSIQLDKLIDKTIELASTDYNLKKHYDFKNITIIKEFEPDLPLVICEQAKVQQVLFNLLQNGAQAMEQVTTRSSQFIIRLKRDPDDKKIIIEIEDNGPGMDQTTAKRVFEPFFTTKSVDEGTGLGLSISYFIITKNHNGEMFVESIEGIGTKFIIKLPL